MKKALINLLLSVSVISLLFVGIQALPFIPGDTVKADGENWLTGYDYRKPITINGSVSGVLTDYQVKLYLDCRNDTDSLPTIYLNHHVQADFGDIAFTTSDGDTTLDFWIESISDLVATVWIELDSIPESPDSYTFYLYYGDPDSVVEFVSRLNDMCAYQGVATDGTYLYNTGWDEDEEQEYKIYKRTMSGSLVTSHEDPQLDGTDVFQVNGVFVKDGYLYIGAANIGGGGSLLSYIKVFNASDLSYVEEHHVKDYLTEGCVYYDGSWYVFYDQERIISRYNDSWVWQEDYNLPFPDARTQSIIFGDDDYVYINNHEDYGEGGNDRFGVDVYTFNGTDFTYQYSIKPPTTECTQGFYPDSDGVHIWWVERHYVDGSPAYPHNIVKSGLLSDATPSVSESDGDATFLIFDHFDDESFDTAKWTNNNSATIDESGTDLTITSSSDDWRGVLGKVSYSAGKRWRSNLSIADDQNDYNNAGMGAYFSTTYQSAVFFWGTITSEPNDAMRTGDADSVKDTLMTGDDDKHNYEIRWLDDSVEFLIDDEQTAMHETDLPALDMYLRFGVYDDPNSQIVVDWVFLANYADPEPQLASVGSEEIIRRLVLYIDGVEKDSYVFCGTVSDNESDWIFCVSGSVVYMESASIVINDTPVSSWEWEYGSTFQDSIGSNDAIPTFRTSSSDADVTAELIRFQPYNPPTVDNDTATTWPTIMDDAPELPDTTFTEEERPGIFFEPIIHALATAANLPASLFWYNFAFTIIIGAGIIIYYILAERKNNALFVKIAVQAALMCFFALPGLNIYGFFVPLYYLFFSSGMLILSKDYGW